MGVKGRRANVSLRGAIKSDATILSVYTIGKDDPTTAEETRAHVVRMALKRTSAILTQPFVKAIWLPETLSVVLAKPSALRKVDVTFTQRPLNPSQRMAVEAILDDSPSRRHVIVHGGPGTGEHVLYVAIGIIQTKWLVLVRRENDGHLSIGDKSHGG